MMGSRICLLDTTIDASQHAAALDAAIRRTRWSKSSSEFDIDDL